MACSVSSLDWARIHCAKPGRFSDSQYAAIERYWYAEKSSFLICSFIASSTALPSKVTSSFSSFAMSRPPLYRSPGQRVCKNRRRASPRPRNDLLERRPGRHDACCHGLRTTRHAGVGQRGREGCQGRDLRRLDRERLWEPPLSSTSLRTARVGSREIYASQFCVVLMAARFRKADGGGPLSRCRRISAAHASRPSTDVSTSRS